MFRFCQRYSKQFILENRKHRATKSFVSSLSHKIQIQNIRYVTNKYHLNFTKFRTATTGGIPIKYRNRNNNNNTNILFTNHNNNNNNNNTKNVSNIYNHNNRRSIGTIPQIPTNNPNNNNNNINNNNRLNTFYTNSNTFHNNNNNSNSIINNNKPSSILSRLYNLSKQHYSAAAPLPATKWSRNTSVGASYESRHIGPQTHVKERELILNSLGVSNLDELMDLIVPKNIKLNKKLDLPEALSEKDALKEIYTMMHQNLLYKSYIGMGYYNTQTPSVILRNMIENPSWYTPYTPYQAEISQGRLEMLCNFQQMVSDLTGKDICNSSLLDEATACAEAMTMCLNMSKKKFNAERKPVFLMSENCHLQNITVTLTRAEPLGIEVRVVPDDDLIGNLSEDVIGVLVQYPNTNGRIVNFTELAEKTHQCEAIMVAATDILACAIVKPPGEWGADIVVGSAQRFGVPLGFGGPHAAFLATDEDNIRKIPGRIIGITRDRRGKAAYRMALQTREQHIRREKATSNICTAQALLANVSAAYGVFHGPHGIKNMSTQVNNRTKVLAHGLKQFGCKIRNENLFFDTITMISPKPAKYILEAAWAKGINFRPIDVNMISISLDEATQLQDINDIFEVFEAAFDQKLGLDANELILDKSIISKPSYPEELIRSSKFMTHKIFNSFHSETAMMRYLYQLEKKDFGLNTGMIPLGSCTMKLNAASAMRPLTSPYVNSIHPFAPAWQTKGYNRLISDMEAWFTEITQFAAVSLQPNSGAQGEYTGLMAIRAYHLANKKEGDPVRNICLIPTSAHGTNPASAAAAGYKIISVKCDASGNIDLQDLAIKAKKYEKELAACMVTYPSTHGVFEENIVELCDIVHNHGGLVYMDGANMQAQVGYTAPGLIGADVCHLNLHKTFCIPHGGGGPGLGPIGVNEKLKDYLPSHPVIPCGKNENKAIGAVAAAPWSSASILVIPWMYITMMGPNGLKNATAMSIANANYMAKQLESEFKILYRGMNGYCAHEFIIDLRDLKNKHGITAEDIAKRLMDYGFHAPTMSFPVAETLMIEPTESEPLSELDRLCNALKCIKGEINDIISGKYGNINESPLKNAPHTCDMVINDNWDRKYTRIEAVYPYIGNNPGEKHYWPTVGRVDNVFGDKNLFCSCPSVEQMASNEWDPNIESDEPPPLSSTADYRA